MRALIGCGAVRIGLSLSFASIVPLASANEVIIKAAEDVNQQGITIIGDQELPRVLYIVPWKDPALGDLVGKPVNSLVDEALAPVDREVFRRQISYFDQLYGDPGVPIADP